MKMFLLNHQQRVKKWLTDKNFIEATLTEQINAADELKFSLPLKARLPASFYFAVIPRPRHDDYLLFKIIQEQVQNDRIQYTCVEAAYDELKSYNYIKDVRPRDRTASNMLQIALQGTRWSVGQVLGGGTSSTNFYYVNTLEAIQKIVNLFNLEAVFSVGLDKHNARVVRRQVNLYSQQGERTGKRFEYGSNLLTVEREENSENLVTALIGRGKGEEIYHDADGNKTTAPAGNTDDAPDGYGRRINFADVVWSKAAGNPVDKPAGQEYVEDPNATAIYGFDDGKPRIGLEVFEDITDPNELLQATWKALQVLKRPKVSFKASVMDVGSLGLGDTVAIIRHDIQIEYFTRVYKVTHNLLDEKQNTIELGDDFSSHSMTSTIASMSGAIEKAQQTAGYAATSANGKNTNFYSQDKPAYAVEGDLWYKDLGNGETDLYQYHDGNWILISSTRELNQAKKEIDQQLDNLKQLEKNKGIDIDEIKKDMKSVEDTANQAFKNGETNRTDLDKLDGEITGRITEVLTNGGYATQSWTQGQFKLNKSSFDVQIANVLKTTNSNSGKIDSLNGSINGMNKTIDGINTNVCSNATKIAQLIVDLKGIQSTVASKADISQVNQKADEWSVKVEGLDKKLEERTGVNPNMLNGTPDWSGNWNEELQMQFPLNDIPNMDPKAKIDGTTDPNGNQTIFYSEISTVNKVIFLEKGIYTLSAWEYSDLDGHNGSAFQKIYSIQNNKIGEFTKISETNDKSAKKWIRKSKTYEVTKAGYIVIYIDAFKTHVGSPKLEKGDKATAWVPSANDPYKGTGESLSMINVDAGNILFKSKKLYLDADSTIFSGKAFIPDAAISNLSADKITTGTLNAGLINVININAKSITTGTIQGTNLSINLNSGEVKFQRGRIHDLWNYIDINIDQNYISTASWSTRALLKDGELQLTQPNIFDTNSNQWYFRLYNSGGTGDSWTGATLVGRDSITIVNKDNNTGATGFSSNPIGTDGFSGFFTGKGTATDWLPTIIGGADRGIFMRGGTSLTQGHNIFDMGNGTLFETHPYIAIGTNANTSAWYGNRVVIEGEYVHIPSAYRNTASSGSWLMVAPDGALIRSTSASKYKTDIQRSYVWDYGDKLLELPTATWIDKAEMRRFNSGESKTKPKRNFGMIAEDLAEAGLEMLVQRNNEGGLEGIQYDRIGPALIPVIKNLKDRIEKLEEKLNEQ
ncbi:MAG TPA: phage tail protein [Candidatus Limosilactobacillus intestinavium]|nr:phage tail protein [Candidatus Limosilactobacillus intestinavium]